MAGSHWRPGQSCRLGRRQRPLDPAARSISAHKNIMNRGSDIRVGTAIVPVAR